MLADSQIKMALHLHHLEIDPLDPDDIQPASVDLHLGTTFRMFDDSVHWGHGYSTPAARNIDPFRTDPDRTKRPLLPKMLETFSSGPLYLEPLHLVLGHTQERIKLSHGLLGRLEGKSSLGRLGLAVHITAGFFDPGWDGQGTLEIVNFSPHTWVLRPGMPICQMAFDYITGHVDRPYGEAGNHYQGSEGVVPARTD